MKISNASIKAPDTSLCYTTSKDAVMETPFPKTEQCLPSKDTSSLSSNSCNAVYACKPIEKPDYSSMTDIEIYDAVVSDYKAMYGEYFLERRIMGLMPRTYEEALIIMNFDKELEKQIGGGSKGVREVARKAAYGDLTDNEVRRIIIENYTKTTPMTLRSFMEMSYEMRRVGVDVGVREIAENLSSAPHGTYMPFTPQERADYMEGIMNKPLDIKGLAMTTNGMRFANSNYYNSEASYFIANLFGIPINSNGYLEIPTSLDFDLTGSYIAYTIRGYENSIIDNDNKTKY